MKNESFVANLLINTVKLWFTIMFKVEVKGKEVALNRLHIGNRDTKGVKR